MENYRQLWEPLKGSTGCPKSQTSLCFWHFLGFWSTYRGTSDLYSAALEICYMIATKILKFDSDIAEIIEVKVGTSITPKLFFDSAIAKFQFLNDGCQLWPQLSQLFLNQFSKFLCLSCSKFPGLLNKDQKKMCSRTRENDKNKVGTYLWDTL